MVFAVFVSILLNLLSILCIIILFVRQTRFIQLEKRQKETLAETETMLEAFLEEWKEDQITLLNTLTQSQKQSVMNDNKQSTAGKSTQPLSVRNTHNTKVLENDSFDHTVINLYNQGYDVKEIAQKMNKGITEIELVLKFYQKSNN